MTHLRLAALAAVLVLCVSAHGQVFVLREGSIVPAEKPAAFLCRATIVWLSSEQVAMNAEVTATAATPGSVVERKVDESGSGFEQRFTCSISSDGEHGELRFSYVDIRQGNRSNPAGFVIRRFRISVGGRS